MSELHKQRFANWLRRCSVLRIRKLFRKWARTPWQTHKTMADCVEFKCCQFVERFARERLGAVVRAEVE